MFSIDEYALFAAVADSGNDSLLEALVLGMCNQVVMTMLWQWYYDPSSRALIEAKIYSAPVAQLVEQLSCKQ